MSKRRLIVNERVKNQILIVAFALLIACFIMTTTANKSAGQSRQELDQERYQRFNAEQNLSEANKRINSLESEIAGLRDRIQSVQTILDEGKNQTSDLKSQLDNMTKTKETLEKKIGELQSVSAQSTQGQSQP